MINIGISAIKGGYRELFQTTSDAPFGLASAIRSDSGSPFSVGEEAFVISYTNKGFVFTKCKIIRDGLAGSRVGNIAISVLIPLGTKMTGENIFTLLNKILHTYTFKYIDSDNNLGDVYEDWNFVTEISREYEGCLSISSFESTQNLTHGTEKGAFIYYSSDEELQKYLDVPYQEEYIPFSQIFLVESTLQGKPQNPLNALQHDPTKNLTDKIDLDNPKYKIKEFHGNGKQGVTIEIWAGPRRIYNKDSINRKDNLRIRYSKSYFIPINEEGKLTDDNISKYLTIEGDKIVVKNDVQLEKEPKEILLHANDINGREIPEVVFTYQNTSSHTVRKVENNKIRFEGEELKETWSISAEKGNLKTKPIAIIPKDSSGNVYLTLAEHKIVKFEIKYNEGTVLNADIQIENKSTTPGQYEIEFTGEEINKKFNIQIFHKDYETPPFTYCPATDQNPKIVNLTKKTTQTNPAATIPNISGTPVPEQPKQKVPFYQKNGALAAIVITVLAIPVGLILWLSGMSEATDNSDQILAYVQGIELKKDILESFNEANCSANPSSSESTGKGFLEKIFSFGSKHESPDYCSQIQKALSIRSAINKGDIDSLIGKTYIKDQVTFERSVKSIDPKYKVKIGETIRAANVSNLDLNEIAVLIKNLQTLLKIRDFVKTTTDTMLLKNKKMQIEDIKFPIIDIDSIKTNILNELVEKAQKNNLSIVPKLGSDIGKGRSNPKSTEQKKKPKQDNSGNFKDDFWALIYSDDPKVEDFATWAKNYPYNEFNKEYRVCYNELLNNESKVNAFAKILIRDRKKVTTIEALKKLINENK
jgi:hypothetical protein